MNFVEDSLRQNRFWLRIMAEHALFLRLGLPCDELALIKEARELEELFRGLLSRANRAAANPTAVSELNMAVIEALNRIIVFKSRILGRLITCNLGGSNLPLLVDHIRREAIRFRINIIRLQNNIDILPAEEALQEEIFWLRIMGDHARFIAHLLDPSERMLVSQARQFAEQFETLRLQANDIESMVAPRTFEDWLLPENMISLPETPCISSPLPEAFVIPRLVRFNGEAIRAVEDIRNFKRIALELISACTVLSNIPPLLADHVLREAQMALEDLGIMEQRLRY